MLTSPYEGRVWEFNEPVIALVVFDNVVEGTSNSLDFLEQLVIKGKDIMTRRNNTIMILNDLWNDLLHQLQYNDSDLSTPIKENNIMYTTLYTEELNKIQSEWEEALKISVNVFIFY